MAAALDLVRPLAEKNAVNLPEVCEFTIPAIAVPNYAMRHALLSLLNALIPANPGSSLRINPTIEKENLRLALEIHPAKLDSHSALAIEAARSLLERVGGQIISTQDNDVGFFVLALPAFKRMPILVIDDHPDMIQLFTRYVQDTHYSVTGVLDWRQAFVAVQAIAPRIVILDVMMPGMDGWELLGRLRHTLAGQPTQIVICSILPQAAIAQSLRADGFLQKPVLPQDFLAMLEMLEAKWSAGQSEQQLGR